MDRDSFLNDLRSFREQWDIFVAEEGIEKIRRDFRNLLSWGIHNDAIKENEITEYPDGELIWIKQVDLIFKAPLDSEGKEFYDIKIFGPSGEELDFDIIGAEDVSAH